MITRITGTLVHLSNTEATLAVGPFEYEVFVPDFVRRQLQSQLNQEISLKTIEYLEGNPQRGRMTPRMVGFISDVELEFFELICSVDGLGVKKALRSMVRPVCEVAAAIEEQDVKTLSTLPGIGPAVAERVVAKLRRKMTKFALMVSRDVPDRGAADTDILLQATEALLSLGHSGVEARDRIDTVLELGLKFKSVEDILRAIYQQQLQS